MTTTSRRGVLAGAAAIPALSLPAVAESDPIFAGIEQARITWEESEEILSKSDEWDNEACSQASDAWNAAHHAIFRTVPTTRAGAGALIAYAFECAKRQGDWETALGDYNRPNTEGEMELAGNNTVELLESLAQFLRAA